MQSWSRAECHQTCLGICSDDWCHWLGFCFKMAWFWLEANEKTGDLNMPYTISDQEFETFWPLTKFYHNRYTLGLQILYSCQFISHEHGYIFYFFIVQLWKLTEASWSLKVIVSGNWNGCHIQVTSNCQILIGWMLLILAFSLHIWSAQNHACHAQQTKN